MGFVLALAAVGTVPESAPAIASVPATHSTLEHRLANLSAALQQRANQSFPASTPNPEPTPDIIGGFANGRSGRGFADTRRGGWGDGRGGSFVNVNNPWRNGWRDGGGFYNRRWPDGGSFINRW
jgi:rSAM-associated Gly-rich repeat protein